MTAPRTLLQALEESIARWPDRPALSCDGTAMTYAELGTAAARLAAAYRTADVGPGDRVVCQLPNSMEHVIALVAAWSCGAVHLGVDHQLTGRELSWLARRASPRAILYEPQEHAPDSMAALHAVCREVPDIGVFVSGNGTAAAATPASVALRDILPTWGRAEVDRVRSGGNGIGHGSPRTQPGMDRPRAHQVDPGAAALILVTSGTTGEPKLCVGYHGPLADGWRWIADTAGFVPSDVHLGHLPLSHGFGLSMAVMALMTGGCVVLMRTFSAQGALEAVTEECVTVLNGTPAHYILLTDRLDRTRHDVRTLRIGVGTAAAFPPPLLRRIFDELGMGLMIMYGSAEGLTVVTTDREEMLMGSVGKPEPGFVSIVAPDGAALPLGQVGEIALRRGSWRLQYWGESGPADLDAAEWYFTGDAGRLDSEGRLYVLGRIKQQIDRGGLKVDPGEVEALLLRCPGIRDAAVTGVPNPVLGEVVCACVVPAGGTPPSLTDVRKHLASDLAPFKLPEALTLMSAIPRTALGKIDRVTLRALVAANRVEETGGVR